MKELKVWLKYTNNSFQQMLTSRVTMAIFMTGKIFRILMFLAFLIFLFQGANSLAGYSRNQIIFFYLSFNLIDTLAQLFFREVYRFRPLIVSGNFDFVLLKPINPLIRVLLGGGDVLDLLTLLLTAILTAAFAWQNLPITGVNVFLYLILILNGLLIAAAFHIFVLGLGIITTSVDHLVMIYRDMASMARIPIDVYIDPIRTFLTFVIPLGIMITFPAKAFMGILSWQFVGLAMVFGIVGISFSLLFWNYAVRKYSSASS